MFSSKYFLLLPVLLKLTNTVSLHCFHTSVNIFIKTYYGAYILKSELLCWCSATVPLPQLITLFLSCIHIIFTPRFSSLFCGSNIQYLLNMLYKVFIYYKWHDCHIRTCCICMMDYISVRLSLITSNLHVCELS